MTVKQLKKELEKYPDNMEVVLAETKTEFAYGELNSVKKKKLGFREEPDSKDLASAMCVVLDEDY